MKDQLKAIIIKNLAKMPDFLTESLVFIPKPKEINKLDNNNAYILTSECILIPKNVENVKVLSDDISEFLEEYTNIKLTEDTLKEIDNDILDDKSEWNLLDINNPESYNLEIDNNQVRIFSKFEKGLYYGVQTFIQLMKNAFLSNQKLLRSPKDNRNQLILPEIEIKDVPDLRMRGVANDISRGQIFTVKSAKRYIKILSHYKMNFYFLYIEDMFKHSKHPKIGAGRGALTIKEIKEIDKYAKERHVELVPIFECLGHADNILTHKKYEDLGEFPGSQCFDISNPDVIPFLNDYVSKLSESFSTNYFHIGCDESFDLAKGKSKEFVEHRGKSKALVDYYEKLYTLAKENNNVNIIMYDDVVRDDEEILKNLNKDLILMHWDYKPRSNYPKVEELLNAGFRVIVSPSMLNWQRHFPDNKHASKNIIKLINIAYKNRNNGCLGVLTSSWGDQRYYSLRENEIFAAILTGAISWTAELFNYRNFKNEYGYLFYGIERNRLKEFNQLFTLLSSSASLYHKISIQSQPLFYTHLFKHPFPTKKFEISFKSYNKFNDIIEKCLKIYENIKTNVLFEKTNFDYIKFSMDLAKFLVEKIQLSVYVSDALSKYRVLDDTIDKIINQIEDFKEKTITIKAKYSNHWLISAKKDGLNLILQLFDFLILCYDKKIKQLKLKIKFTDPFLESEWIWIDGDYNPEKPIYFRKTVEIYQKPRKAIIQCIAGNYMKVFVNNKFVGEVYSRFSLSSLPITQRVKTFNITKILKEGENIIAVEAYNFPGYQGAFNIYGQNQLNYNRIQQIYTDPWWTCFNDEILESDDWKNLEFDDSHWSMVKSYGRPPNLNGDVFKPALLEGEVSITQDNFGFEEFMKNFIPKQFIRQLAKLQKHFG